MATPASLSSTLSCWSHLETDFDAEDETGNFGTRMNIRANDGDMFDVVTLALAEPKVSGTKGIIGEIGRNRAPDCRTQIFQFCRTIKV